MHKMAGLLVILNKLDKGEVTTKQLAEDFEVSTRTIQRCINEIELAQFSIVSLKLGTYSFQEGDSLKFLTGTLIYNYFNKNKQNTILGKIYA